MYPGPLDVRITARCPFCGAVTVKEMNYRLVAIGIGTEKAKVIDAFNCRVVACGKVAFKEVRELSMEKEAVIVGRI